MTKSCGERSLLSKLLSSIKDRKFVFKSSGNSLVSQVMSKYHALISSDEDKLFLSDCGSSNGTFINNFRLRKEASRK